MGPILLTQSKIAAESLVSIAGERYRQRYANEYLCCGFKNVQAVVMRCVFSSIKSLQKFLLFFCVCVCFFDNWDHFSDLVSMEAH